MKELNEEQLHLVERSMDDLKLIPEAQKIDKLFKDLDIKEEKLDETNTTAAISGYKALVSDIVKSIDAKDDMKYFCSVIKAITPEGVIPVSSATNLTGAKDEEGNVSDTLRILDIVSDTFTVGDTITSSGTGEGTVIFKQDNYILIKVNVGVFAQGETINTIAINKIYPASHLMGTLLSDYAGDYASIDSETEDNLNEIEFKLRLIEISVKSQLVSTGYTTEAIKDLIAQYGKNMKSLLVSGMTLVINTINRQKTINYMKANAVVRSNINLVNSVGGQGGIDKIYADLYSRVNQSMTSISTSTGIKGKYAVVCSSNVASGLRTYLGDKIKVIDDQEFLPLGIALVEDGYSREDYLLVTLRGNNGDNNSAVVFSPYSYALLQSTNYINFHELIKVQVRSDVKNNQLASLVSGKNELMEYTLVEGFSDLTNNF